MSRAPEIGLPATILKTTAPAQSRRLDKPLFEAGQQCLKRLFLDFRQPVEEEPSEQRRALSAAGQQLLALARKAFPRGAEVTATSIHEAAAQTRELLAAASASVVFGAVFQSPDLEVRTDIILRQKDGQLDLFEVKSGTKVNARYLADIAMQVLAIEGAGFQVRAVHVLHVNHRYTHKEGEDYPPQQLFKNADVTERVRRTMPRIADQVRAFRQQVRDDSALGLPTGSFCTNPFPCPHLAECTLSEKAFPLRKLPELTQALEAKLHEEGIDDLADMQLDRQGLTFRQRQTLRCVQEQKLVVEPFVREELRQVDYPLHFLAICGITEALPRFSGQRPWRLLPYAWAVETVYENGRVERSSFAFADKTDPRAEFAATLHKQLGDQGTILCWSTDALESLRSLIEDLPTEKPAVRALLGMPRFDIMRLFESGVFHPELLGETSLLASAQALANMKPASDLSIRSDETVFAALQKAWTPRVRAATKEKIAAELKAWVEWQAAAIAQLHIRFAELAPKQPEAPASKPAKPRKQLPPT